ncbi:MAG: GNAT family N-acetyltransferase [Candidatus Peregrinibacteria bacterium]
MSYYAEHHSFYRALNVDEFTEGSLKLVEHSLDFAQASLDWVTESQVGQFMGADFSNVNIQTEIDRIKEILANANAYEWVILLDDQPIGAISINGIREETEKQFCKAGNLTFLIGYAEHRKKGIASAVIRQILHWAFEEAEFHMITARVLQENSASQRTLLRLGFEEYGTEPYEGLVNGQKRVWLKYRVAHC